MKKYFALWTLLIYITLFCVIILIKNVISMSKIDITSHVSGEPIPLKMSEYKLTTVNNLDGIITDIYLSKPEHKTNINTAFCERSVIEYKDVTLDIFHFTKSNVCDEHWEFYMFSNKGELIFLNNKISNDSEHLLRALSLSK
jgi:hypothetical protein